MQTYQATDLWQFLPWGYLLTIALETPVLLIGLSAAHPFSRRIFSGFWLTACTYPIVVLVMPLVIAVPFGHLAYLIIAETFAPAAECFLFWLAFYNSPKSDSLTAGKPTAAPMLLRDFATIVVANLVSFLVGGALISFF